MQTLTLSLECLTAAGLEMHYENGEIIIRNARITDFKPGSNAQSNRFPDIQTWTPNNRVTPSPAPCSTWGYMRPIPEPVPMSSRVAQYDDMSMLLHGAPIETKLFNLMSNPQNLKIFLDQILRGDSWVRMDKDEWWYSPDESASMYVPTRYRVSSPEKPSRSEAPWSLVHVLQNSIWVCTAPSTYFNWAGKPGNLVCGMHVYIDPEHPKCLSIDILQPSYNPLQANPYKFISQAMSRVTGDVSSVDDAYMGLTTMLTQLDGEVSLDLLGGILQSVCKVSRVDIIDLDQMLLVPVKMTIEVYEYCVKIYKPQTDSTGLVLPYFYGDPTKVLEDEIAAQVFYVHITEGGNGLEAKLTHYVS